MGVRDITEAIRDLADVRETERPDRSGEMGPRESHAMKTATVALLADHPEVPEQPGWGLLADPAELRAWASGIERARVAGYAAAPRDSELDRPVPERAGRYKKVQLKAGCSYIVKLSGVRLEGRSVDGEYDGGKTIDSARDKAADFAARGVDPNKIRIGKASEDGDKFEAVEHYADFIKVQERRVLRNAAAAASGAERIDESYNQPGKFELSGDVGERLHEIVGDGGVEDERGDVNGPGDHWYGLIIDSGVPGAEHVVVSESSHGAFEYEVFDTADTARADFDRIAAELEEEEDEGDEEDEEDQIDDVFRLASIIHRLDPNGKLRVVDLELDLDKDAVMNGVALGLLRSESGAVRLTSHGKGIATDMDTMAKRSVDDIAKRIAVM